MPREGRSDGFIANSRNEKVSPNARACRECLNIFDGSKRFPGVKLSTRARGKIRKTRHIFLVETNRLFLLPIESVASKQMPKLIMCRETFLLCNFKIHRCTDACIQGSGIENGKPLSHHPLAAQIQTCNKIRKENYTRKKLGRGIFEYLLAQVSTFCHRFVRRMNEKTPWPNNAVSLPISWLVRCEARRWDGTG